MPPPCISHGVRPFGKGATLFRGLTITMVINHLQNGVIFQVGGLVEKGFNGACRRGVFQKNPKGSMGLVYRPINLYS